MADDPDETLRRAFGEPRKRAPFTGTSFDSFRMRILCPKCQKEGLQPVSELVVNDDAICPYCGNVIDLKPSDAEIVQVAEIHKKIKPDPRR